MFERERGNKTTGRAIRPWARLSISLRAMVSGLVLAVIAINVWPLLILKLGTPLAAFAEAIFLVCFWWTSGGGSPRSTKVARAMALRAGKLSSPQWFWGLRSIST